jgi:hypothetical protein
MLIKVHWCSKEIEMPKRTNSFQELVSLIHTSMCGDGEKVTESAMVKVHGLETEREIDILFEKADAIYKVKIAVEAKDEGRPMDLDGFDHYVGKYRGPYPVDVQQFVVISRNGFTKGVREKAAAMGVPLMTLDEAEDFDWTKLDPKYGPLKQESMLHVRMAPHVCRIVFDPPIRGDQEGKAAVEGKLVCEHSTDHGTPFEFARRAIFEKKDPPTIAKLKEAEALAVGQPNGAEMHAGFDMSHYKLRFRQKDHQLVSMTVIVHMIDARTTMECKAYELDTPDGKKIFHHMSGTLGEKHFQWVMPQGLKSKKMALKIGKPPKAAKTPKQKAEERKKKRKRGK